MIGVAAAIAALSMRFKAGVAASVAAIVLARPEFVTICNTSQWLNIWITNFNKLA